MGRGKTLSRRAAVGGLLSLAACSRPRSGGSHMVIGVSTLRISLPVFVAVEHGLFAKHGIDAEVRRYDTAQPLADELGASRIEAGGYVAFPILFGPGAPPPRVRVVTAVVEDAGHPLSYLLVKKGSGLRGVAALRGRRIGILPTAAYRRWLEAILRHDGLGPEDVSIVPLAPSLEADALAGGGVDALFTGDPMATAAIARGLAEPATDTPDVPRVLGEPFLFGTFAVTEDFARRAPRAGARARGRARRGHHHDRRRPGAGEGRDGALRARERAPLRRSLPGGAVPPLEGDQRRAARPRPRARGHGGAGGDRRPAVIVAALDRVRVLRGDLPVLREASLCLRAGDRVALVGPNGAGKSTLVRVLLGLTSPAEGAVRRAATGVGYVPQGYAESLFPWFSVLRNVAMPLLVARREGAYDAARALTHRILPGVDPGRRAGRLSGGEKQATALARALASPGDLVIADEPFSAIAASSRGRLRLALREGLGGRALLLVTHDAGDVADLCERTVQLVDGRTVEAPA